MKESRAGSVFGWEPEQMISFPLWACQGLAVSYTTMILVPAFCEVLIIENCHFYVLVVCLAEATSRESHIEALALLKSREREVKIVP